MMMFILGVLSVFLVKALYNALTQEDIIEYIIGWLPYLESEDLEKIEIKSYLERLSRIDE